MIRPRALAAVIILLLPTMLRPVAAQTWIELFPTGGPSGPILTRQPVGIGYDASSNRLVVTFATNPGVTGLSPEVWVLTNANGLGGTPAWIQLAPAGSIPTNINDSPAVVYDEANNRLISYGGCGGGCSPAQTSVYVLSNANGLGGTPTWTLSTVTNPQARTFHSAVFDPVNDRMISFAGQLAFFGTDQNDTRVLTDASGLASPSTWSAVATSGGPPAPREFHPAVYDRAGNRMTVFGGVQYPTGSVAINFNDTWVLSNANGLGGPSEWTQLLPASPIPDGRSRHSAVYDPVGNRMILFGGFEDLRPNPFLVFGDVWVLSNANGLGGAPSWTELAPTGSGPGPNYAHRAVFDSANQRMIVFGGADGGFITHKRVFVLDLFEPPPPPEEATEELIEEVEEIVETGLIPANQEQSLTPKLEAAAEKIEDGNPTAATNQLGSFINKVNALLNSNKITPEVAQALIDAAESIIDQLASAKESAEPDGYFLSQAYPNPFNPATHIRYGLAHGHHVELIVYDALGRRVATLVDAWQQAGDHDVRWDAQGVAAGVYIYRIRAGGFMATGRMILLK